MKTNFRKNENSEIDNSDDNNEKKQNLTQEEFEDFIIKSGAKGSFMVYRSSKKENELGLDEL